MSNYVTDRQREILRQQLQAANEIVHELYPTLGALTPPFLALVGAALQAMAANRQT